MEKVVLLLALLFLPPVISNAEDYPVKLRTSHNPGHLRIVLEGREDLISKAIVNQKAQNILVTFPDTNFTIEAEKAAVTYKKTDKNAVMFSPGEFRGMKVLTLNNPDRLVIDVFKDDREESPPLKKDGTTRFRGDEGGFFQQNEKSGASKTKTLVIDPGHGGFESGIVSGDYAEKTVALDIAGKLGILADKGAFRSFLTRDGDFFKTDAERARYANDRNADVFLGLHVGNHSDVVIYIPVITESAAGTADRYLYGQGQKAHIKKTVSLLNAMKEAFSGEFGNDMVKVKPLPYSILAKIEAAALLIELPSFETAYTEEFRMRTTNALNRGLYLYEENEAK
ncbi:MAG: hypothetical protein C4560_00750 [Nitrospiraceae bacterium]|nr:MAG: hypothetical protein C4560_00750 [Nitrospiraceae bacterium]